MFLSSTRTYDDVLKFNRIVCNIAEHVQSVATNLAEKNEAQTVEFALHDARLQMTTMTATKPGKEALNKAKAAEAEDKAVEDKAAKGS